MSPFLEETGRLLSSLRERKPRIHCLTNSVAQKFTADGLSALGAHPSMTQNVEEVAAFAASADALLVNLGTLEEARRAAIPVALDAIEPMGKPWTLDPVHCERSPVRLAFARELVARGPAVLRGNRAEMALLGNGPPGTVSVTTGPVDRLQDGERTLSILNGDPLMTQVTATGCLAGALIAAFLTVSEDRMTGAGAALLFYGVCAEIAAQEARGPGSFAAALFDALANVTPRDIIERGRVET